MIAILTYGKKAVPEKKRRIRREKFSQKCLLGGDREGGRIRKGGKGVAGKRAADRCHVKGIPSSWKKKTLQHRNEKKQAGLPKRRKRRTVEGGEGGKKKGGPVGIGGGSKNRQVEGTQPILWGGGGKHQKKEGRRDDGDVFAMKRTHRRLVPKKKERMRSTTGVKEVQKG